jgi:putative hydrolase of HD superfamily
MKIEEGELDHMIDFMLTADKLKGIERTGWVLRGVDKPEHVGDHSFSMALLSYLLAGRMGLDAGKCAALGLVHDLAEADTGDMLTRAREEDQPVSRSEKGRLVRVAMSRIISLLGKDLAPAVGALWDEYEKGSSEEARLVAQVDKLDIVLMLVKYSKYLGDDAVDEFLFTTGSKITIPEVRYIYEELKRKLVAMRKK